MSNSARNSALPPQPENYFHLVSPLENGGNLTSDTAYPSCRICLYDILKCFKPFFNVVEKGNSFMQRLSRKVSQHGLETADSFPSFVSLPRGIDNIIRAVISYENIHSPVLSLFICHPAFAFF